ncbi:hypothetical protein E2C01_092376 [Portunus trituberculatus]|uniref:PHD-type domain-containing protein n=1 Tax=Portunus trituberculatus TaxID=210409 RepID=A0A5B7JR83_PORTR|nr:hypothetical protein [Portunus trituberculatus]
MENEEATGRDRNAKIERCRRYEYNGRVNGDGLCGSCSEEVTRKRELCPTCNRWVEKGGAECTRCGFWRHKECEGLTEAGLKLVTSMDTWFCKPCSAEWKVDKKEYARMREELKGLKHKNVEISNKIKVLENRCNSWSKEVEDSDETELPLECNPKKGEKDARDRQHSDMASIKEEIKKLRQDNENFRDMIVNLENR